MTYRGTVKGNVVVLEPAAKLPDGTRVRVETETAQDRHSGKDGDQLFQMGELAADTGITDLATNADHYLYVNRPLGSLPGADLLS